MQCDACTLRGKTWEGGEPRCAFANVTFGDNWNCATVNAIRDAVPRHGDVHSRARLDGADDQSWASISLDGIELESDHARTLWLSWYKNRGRTESMWLLDESAPPRLPTEDDLVRIARALGTLPTMQTR